MSTLQKKYCITTENRVVITDQVYQYYTKVSLKLTGYSEVPRSQAYCIYASMWIAVLGACWMQGGVSVPSTLWEVAPATVTSAQVCQSGGQYWPNTERYPGISRPPPCAPVPTLAPIPIQILLQKAWSAFLVLNISCGVHSVDLTAGYKNIMTGTSAKKLVF